jgi:adenylate kinase
MYVIALVGFSGVGKSTLLAELEQSIPLRHFAASDVIKAELARCESRSVSSDELRLGPVLDNQTLLISGFARCTQGLDGLVVLDGHTVVDGWFGPIEIPAEVFGAANVRHMLFLKAHPYLIVERRTNEYTVQAAPQPDANSGPPRTRNNRGRENSCTPSDTAYYRSIRRFGLPAPASCKLYKRDLILWPLPAGHF